MRWISARLPAETSMLAQTQARAQQVLAGEDVQRQVTVVIVVAVKEAALLIPVQRDVRGVDVQHDLLGSLGMGLDKDLHPQFLDALFPERDLLVAVWRGRPPTSRLSVLLPASGCSRSS
jgi:hypothetical protein